MFFAVKSHTIEEALAAFLSGQICFLIPQWRKTRSIGEGVFCEKYDEITLHLSRTTVQNNHCALRRIAAHILGVKAHGKSMRHSDLVKWREKIAQMPLSRLTPEQLLSFRNAMIRSAGTDELNRAHAITTTNSYLRCAGSMFSKKWRVGYEGFLLPDPDPFSKVNCLPEPSHRYSSNIDPIVLVDAAKSELEKSDPVAYMVFILAFYCGMRRSEIDRLRWEHVDFQNRHIWDPNDDATSVQKL